MTAPIARIAQAALDPERLALKAIRQPRLFPAIIEGLQANKARVKYGCAKALRFISEQRPERLYPLFDSFVHLLDHENRILQWQAIFVLSQLARADADSKIDEMFDKYFSPITGPVMITAANVIQGGARIAQAKPHMADRIAAKMLKVGRARYQTAECRNVAIGHAIVALGDILPLLDNPAPVVAFVRRQIRNFRPATRRKAERFLKSHPGGIAALR